MSETAASPQTSGDQTQRAGRTPRASLGSPEGDDVFGVFDTKIARRFFSYLGPHKKMFAVAQVAVLVSAASQVSLPLLIGRAVDNVVKHDAARFQQTLIAFAVMAAVYTAMFFTEQWLSQRLAQRVIFDIRRAMFAHFQDVSLSFMDKTHVGRIMARPSAAKYTTGTQCHAHLLEP